MEKNYSSQELSNNILQAMKIISDKQISRAQYPTTIQGVIKKCQDTSTGRYSIQYQDSVIQAYAISPSVQYSKDTLVYIFVPNGDLREYKVILGSSKQLSINFVENYKGQDGEYEDTGRSFTPEVNKIRLSSYQKPDPETGSPYKSLIKGQLSESLAAQIKNANHLKISGVVQTNLDNSQKRNGRYGVRVVLLMKNSATGEAEQQEYYFDSNSFIGDPYNYINPTPQSVFLPFESENFERIKSIESFVEGFPNQRDDEPIDIIITDFSINGSYKLSDQEIASVGVVLISKGGFTLKDDKDSINIIANLRVKGKPIDLKEQGAKVYWFRQDARITTSSPTYMQCGGIGWDCLNPYCSFTNYTFDTTIAPTSETTFKCVIVYDNNNYFKEFEIMNPAANYDFYIESSEGTEFQYSTGHPTLTLKNRKEVEGEFIYKWQVRNNQNITKDLKRDEDRENEIKVLTKINQKIKKAVDEKNKIYWKTTNTEEFNDTIAGIPINGETTVEKEEKEKYKNKINDYKTDKDTYKNIYNRISNIIANYQNYQQYVIDNIVYHVNLHEITNFSVFSCSDYKKENDKDFFVGSANITIKNTKAPSLGYNLVIDNGDQVFLYNEAGDSLQNASVDEPYDISDLTYSLYYNGRKIEEKDLNGAEATWKIPASNTLLVGDGTIKDDYYIKTGPKLSFNVKNKYDSNNNNNDILLFLKYKKQVFQAKTYFTFNKEGQNGTNGTGIQFKLEMENNKDAVLTYDNSGNLYNNDNINPQVWKNGNKITLSKSEKEVDYSILQNKDSSFQSLYSTSTPVNNILKLKQKLNKVNIINNNISFDKINNIIEAVYNNGNYKYYADLPIITIIEKFVHGSYRVIYKSGTGFRYVVYKNDGTRPNYNNRLPFEIKIQKSFNTGEWEDVTTYSKQGFTFEWKKYGSNIVSISPDTYKCSATPIEKIVNSNTYNDALLLTIKKNGDIFAYVHIPIHFMLNRYENAALNDWNGSALDIDENGKYILAPQVGAGKKDSNKNNTFTGIVMGVEQTQDNNKIQTQTGLFGYAAGARSIFLDANTGNAQFGLPTKGQIKINVKNQAIIQSGDYPNAGMQIQFSNSPHIYFGSGNFKVEPNGYLYSKGGGNIAGWEIRDNRLFKDSVGMAPDNWKHDEALSRYTGVFWAGGPNNNDYISVNKQNFAKRNFFVTEEGYLFSKFGQIAGWDISSSSLSKTTDFSSVGMSVEGKEDKNSSPVCFWAGTSPTEKNFYVKRNGYLYSKSGNIAGWDISSDMLYKKQVNANNQYTAHVGMSANHVFQWQKDNKDNIPICFWAGTSPSQNGMNFYVKRNGYLFSKYGQIGNWFIGKGGLYHKPDGKRATKTQYKSYLYGERIDYLKQRIKILEAAMDSTTDSEKKKSYKDRRDTNKKELERLQNDIDTGKAKRKNRVKEEKNINSDWKKEMDRTYSNTEDGLYIGADGIRLGSFFNVTELGGLYVTGGKIGGIEICQQGLRSSNWRVTGDGTAYFSQAIINDTDVVDSIIRTSQISGSVGGGGFSGGGVSLGSSGSGASGTTIDPNVRTPGGKTWEEYIDGKIEDAIKAIDKDKIISILKGKDAGINFGRLTVEAETFNGNNMEKASMELATKSYVDSEIQKVKDKIPKTSPSSST